MTAPAPPRPDCSYLPPLPGAAPTGAGLPDAPLPVVEPRRRRGRAAALLVVGALLCSGTGAATAVALTGDEAATASGVVQQTSGAASRSGSTSGTPESAAATVAPSVVTLSVTTTASGPFGRTTTASGTGSGVVLDSDGAILTNAHVVAGAEAITVTFADGGTAPARVVGTDTSSDLAVVRAAGVSDLVPAAFANSDELVVGQAVLAVGAPLGLSSTVTEGIVSTLERPVRTGDGATEQTVIDAVQTDAAINPGNSGGALVDLAGRVVGISSAIATAGDGSTGNIGVGFAIPSNDAVEVAEELLADGTADHAQLGVAVTDGSGDARGAQLQAVTPGGAADAAGLRSGDVVTALGGRVVLDADSLIVAVRDHQPGATVEVVYVRGGETRRTSAVLRSA